MTHRRQVSVAREEIPAPSSWEQPDRLSVDSAVSNDRGARSALRRIPAQCCSFSAVSPVSELSGSSLHMPAHDVSFSAIIVDDKEVHRFHASTMFAAMPAILTSRSSPDGLDLAAWLQKCSRKRIHQKSLCKCGWPL